MARNTILPIVAIALLFSGCCKILKCGPECPPVPATSICCAHEPNAPGHVNEEQAREVDTPPNASDLRVITEKTHVDMQSDGKYILHTAIAMNNDGGNNCSDSTQTFAIITLPQYGIVHSVNAVDAEGRALEFKQCRGQITVRLSYLCRTDMDKITITVQPAPEGSPAACQPSFSVHVYSTKPDPDPSNNYWWWRRQCAGGSEDLSPDAPTWGPHEKPQPSKEGL